MNEVTAPRNLEVVDYRVGANAHYDVAKYDAVRFVGPQNMYQQAVMANAYKRLIGPLAGKRVLDVGCGTGRGVVDFSRDSKFAVGCDASLDMLSFAAQKAQNSPACGLVNSVAQTLPFRSEAFDVVVSLNFLHLFNLDTQRIYVAEMKRVLKPGGILVLEFTNALNGGAIGLIRRWTDAQPGVLTFPHEVPQVIGDGCRIERVYGGPFPTIWRVVYRFPTFFQQIEKIAYIQPFKWFCQRLYYKIKKDA
jgi:ubiquinone/menaquinone biosynthesis C-methylase UbiE